MIKYKSATPFTHFHYLKRYIVFIKNIYPCQFSKKGIKIISWMLNALYSKNDPCVKYENPQVIEQQEGVSDRYQGGHVEYIINFTISAL